jgi:AraC-like DNA-binding protein/ligand-binding sensor protein
MLKSAEIVQRLSQSSLFRDYKRAFGQATHLTLVLRPRELWHQALRGEKDENPFCALMAGANSSCAACLRLQQKLVDRKSGKSATAVCFAGLCDTVVPIHVGKDIVGYLQTGQVALHKPTEMSYRKIVKQLIAWGIRVDWDKVHNAYFHSRRLSGKQYSAMIRLLEIFSQHLSVVANQLLIRQQHKTPPLIVRAKNYIAEHQSDELRLSQVVKPLNISTFYFCRLFKKATGLTFTDYLGRIRVEKAKSLLLNTNTRVSEVAFACGFQSLTHFNRIFKRVVGQSPTAYRRPHFLRERPS